MNRNLQQTTASGAELIPAQSSLERMNRPNLHQPASLARSLTSGPPRLQRTCSCGQHTPGGGECEECKKKRQLQRSGNAAAPQSVPDSVYQALASSGRSLDAGSRREMETHFGHDFSGVRVHTDDLAAQSANAVNASAYTVGRDIVFARDRYQPSSQAGRQLLAHELSHVIQQNGRSYQGGQSLEISPAGDAMEMEAERAADTLDSSAPAIDTSGLPNGMQLQRQEGDGAEAPAALPDTVRRANVGRGGGRFDALLNRTTCTLINTMRIKFNYVDVATPWPDEDTKTDWQERFVERVTDRWSGVYNLQRDDRCSDEPCEQLNVVLNVVPVSSGEHFSADVAYTSTFRGSSVGGRSATLDSLDVDQRRDFPQVPAEHEFGHMLGLPHVHCDRNDDVCYGVTDEEKANIMGQGSNVSKRDYEVFSEVATEISECSWDVVERPMSSGMRGLIGALIGGVGGAGIGAAIGSAFGPLGALIGAGIGLGVGALAGGLIGGLTGDD